MSAAKKTSSTLKSALPFLIVCLPSAITCVLLWARLMPIEWPDSFAYLWRASFNIHYILGRSLTQRILFSACANNLNAITWLQAGVNLLLALVLYRKLRRPNLRFNLILAAGLALFLSSYTFTIGIAAICAEPLYTALLLMSPFILLAPEYRRPLPVFLFGICFIFSRNAAPYLLIFMLLVHSVVCWQWPGRKMALTYGALILIAVFDIALMARVDTSIHLNVVNNMCLRVFPFPERTAYFNKRYGMPTGPFVNAFSGRNVNTAGMDGQYIYGINWTNRAYEMKLKDSYGFSAWVECRGQKSYLDFMLLRNPVATAREFQSYFKRHLNNPNAFGSILARHSPTEKRSNIDRAAGGRAWQRSGLLGFDPFALTGSILSAVGLGNLFIVVALTLAGVIAMHVTGHKALMGLACTTILSSLVLFSLSVFGDGMEIERHLYPALLLYIAGFFLFALAAAEMAHIFVDKYTQQTKVFLGGK